MPGLSNHYSKLQNFFMLEKNSALDSFEIKELGLCGVFLITPRIYSDPRGFSVSTYSKINFSSLGIETTFVDDFTSYSRRGVLRGLHFQAAPHAQRKLVRCSKGEIFDVVADCNPASPTYGKHVSVHLKEEEQTMLYIPEQYAHGFCVLSDEAIVEYKLSNSYHKASVRGVRYDDALLKIDWPISHPTISTQDESWTPLIV